MKKALLILWQLPQILVGLALLPFYTGEHCHHKNAYVRLSTKMAGGISLGLIIILHNGASISDIKHEYGHCVQSMYLGWLYLPIIGLPSLLWAALYRGPVSGYYHFFSERWADRLGGVHETDFENGRKR